MVAEIAALKLKLDSHPLPFTGADLSLRLAIGKAGLNRLYEIPKLTGNHAEQEDHSALVYRLVAKPPEVDGVPVGGAINQLCVLELRRLHEARGSGAGPRQRPRF